MDSFPTQLTLKIFHKTGNKSRHRLVCKKFATLPFRAHNGCTVYLNCGIFAQNVSEHDEIPPGTTHVSFHSYYLPLPDTVTHIHVEKNIGEFPKSLLYLCLGDDFTQPLQNLPESLKILTLGTNYNSPLPLSTIPNLRRLVLGSHYNQPLPSLSILPNLEFLRLGNGYNHPLNDIPATAQTLNLSSLNIPITHFPESTKLVSWSGHMQPLPESLKLCKKLIYLFYDTVPNLPFENVPDIKYLVTCVSIAGPPAVIPRSVKYLTVWGHFSRIADGLPSTLTHLSLNGIYIRTIGKLPNSLTHLSLNCRNSINHIKFSDPLPATLRYLKLNAWYQGTFDATGLDSLETLVLGEQFNQLVTGLPPTLKKLVHTENYPHQLDRLAIIVKSAYDYFHYPPTINPWFMNAK